MTATVTRLGHDTTSVLTVRDEIVSATCSCLATWSAREADPHHQTYAEWALTHTSPAPDAPTYEEQRKAYDLACGLRELADLVSRHPVLAVEMYRAEVYVPVVGHRGEGTPAERYRAVVEAFDGEAFKPAKTQDGTRRTFGGALTVEFGIPTELLEPAR